MKRQRAFPGVLAGCLLFALCGCLGGQTGQADSVARCGDVAGPTVALTSSQEAGFSGEQLLALAEGTHELVAFWPAYSRTPAQGGLLIERLGTTARVTERAPAGCAPVELEVDVHFDLDLTNNLGFPAPVLHGAGDAVLHATSTESAELYGTDIALEEPIGMQTQVGAEETIDSFKLHVTFTPDNTQGGVVAATKSYPDGEVSGGSEVATWPRSP